MINDKSITDKQLESLLNISQNINSDHYLTEVLTEIMENRTLNSKNIAKIVSLSKDINSDHYKTEVLKKVIRDNDLPPNAYDALMGTISDIKSDHYITEVVKELLKNKSWTSANSLDGILEIISNNIGSDHYKTVIYKKIADQKLSEGQLIKVLNSSENINSDHYLSEVLLAFSSRVKGSSDQVKSVYRNTAKSIDSDSSYGRVIKAID